MLRVIVNERMYAFVARIFNLQQSGVLHSGIWLLHGWCHVKQVPFRRTLCVHHTPVYSVTSFEATDYGCMCLAELPLHLLSSIRDLLRATAVTRAWNGYRNYYY